MAGGIVAVGAPSTAVFRVARRPGDPFEPPDWSRARPDGTFGNRFDDPSKEIGQQEAARFRAIYCATQRSAAFGETIARFRPSLSMLAEHGSAGAKAIAAARSDLVDPEDSRRGLIPSEWRLHRQLGATTVDPALRFVDLSSAATIAELRVALAPIATRLGLIDFDLAAVTGPERRLTQACARFVYDQVGDEGRPLFAGLRYLSRLNPKWECWAIFSDRFRHRPGMPEAIFPDDPALLEAASILGLTIETFEGHYLRPWRQEFVGLSLRYDPTCDHGCDPLLPGHRIRIEVMSSWYPEYDRNTNSGDYNNFLDDHLVVAHQRIYHETGRASHVMLPVIRR